MPRLQDRPENATHWGAHFMKQLFLIFIALVIPVFFVTVTLSGVYNRIRSIRRRLSMAFVRVAEDWDSRHPMTPDEDPATGPDGSRQEDAPPLHARHRTLAALLKTATAEPDNTALLNQAVTALNAAIAGPGSFTFDDSGPDTSKANRRANLAHEVQPAPSAVEAFNQLAEEYEAVRCSFIARAVGFQTRFPELQRMRQPGSETTFGTSAGLIDPPKAANPH